MPVVIIAHDYNCVRWTCVWKCIASAGSVVGIMKSIQTLVPVVWRISVISGIYLGLYQTDTFRTLFVYSHVSRVLSMELVCTWFRCFLVDKFSNNTRHHFMTVWTNIRITSITKYVPLNSKIMFLSRFLPQSFDILSQSIKESLWHYSWHQRVARWTCSQITTIVCCQRLQQPASEFIFAANYP